MSGSSDLTFFKNRGAVIRRLFVLSGIMVGILLFSQGAWIQVKAVLAQVLLQRAWSETQFDGQLHKPWPWADHWPVARLKIPGMQVDQIVLSGDSGSVLAFAPGMNRQAALPGQAGTVVISGHRDTHFAFLKKLSPATRIELETAVKTYRYRVSDIRVVDSSKHFLPLLDGEPILLLVTCFPFNATSAGGSLRYVVTAVREQTVLL